MALALKAVSKIDDFWGSLDLAALDGAAAELAEAYAGVIAGPAVTFQTPACAFVTPVMGQRQESQRAVIGLSGGDREGIRSQLMLLNASAVVATLKATRLADEIMFQAVSSAAAEPSGHEDLAGVPGEGTPILSAPRWDEYRRQARHAGQCWVQFLSARSAALSAAAPAQKEATPRRGDYGDAGSLRREGVPALRHAEVALESLTRMHQLSCLLGEA